ncbi:MAG: hypothetical protein ACE5KM_11760 [Planctomycetaceae bacterium]
MAVYLFTYHAYRSWMPDRRQGYVERGKGILPQDHDKATLYNARAVNNAVAFEEEVRWAAIDAVDEIAQKNDWLLYEVATDASHIHVLVGWRGFQPWKEVSNRLKRGVGLHLSHAMDRPGPWFSRGSSRKRIKDRRHFEYLLNDYLPAHGDIRWTRRHTRETTADMHPQLLEADD